ncbi:MAG: cytochrome c peroxidase [Parafilimonas sp.]
MKKFFLIVGLTAFASAYTFLSCSQKTNHPEKEIAQTLVKQVDDFINDCKQLQLEAEKPNPDEKKLQTLFFKARLGYKNFEWAAEYFEPATSRFINGPPVEEVDLSMQVFKPAGLQVIEAFLFPKSDPTKKTALINEMKKMQSNCNKYKAHFKGIDILDWQVFDAAKLEVFRIETLGITGFDDPLTLRSINESTVALKSIEHVMAYYDKKYECSFDKHFNAASNYLTSNTNFNTFNRAEFIRTYCNPVTTDITNLELTLKINTIRYNRLLNQDAKTLFDSNTFNINAYSPNQSSYVTTKKIVLGKLLFADPTFSGTGTRSCKSCHQPEKAFTDGLAKNTVINSKEILARNTPTLINAALQPSQFYDMRVNTLEDQSINVIQNALEMHGSMKFSVQKLWKDSNYKQLFIAAFPKPNRTGIDTLEVMNAIGSYVRSLVFFNSRFDDYMRGNNNAMNADEISGFNLFMGKAKCATCHYMPLFNGTFPPRYIKTEAEVIGIPKALNDTEIDSDLGRYAIVKVASFKHAFKTPTMRNVSRTAPYMHNGIYDSLQQVIDFYNKGGGVGLGINIENQTLSFDRLNLTEKESKDLIAFIKTLNSKY